MNTEIDNTEAVLAVIGVSPLITKAVERFTKEKVEEAVKLPKTIERLARQLARDEVDAVPLFEMNYDRVLRDLYEEWQPAQVEAMARSMEKWAPDVTTGLMARAADVLKYLQGIFPRVSFETFMGSANVVPSDPLLYAFESVLEVLDTPLKVFSLISQGAITKRQVTAIRLVYPTLCEAIDEAITEAVADAKAEKKAYELAPATEVGVRKWFGNPAINPKLAKQLQAVAPKPKPPGPPVPASTTPKSSALAKESLSSAQRAALGPLK